MPEDKQESALAPSLLDRLTSTASPQIRPKVHYDRRKRLVVIEDELAGMPCTFTVARSDLENTLDRIADLWGSTSSLVADEARARQEILQSKLESGTAILNFTSRLFDAVLEAQIRFSGTKPRGIQAGRTSLLLTLKYASAWTVQFVIQEWKKPFDDRYVPLQRAEEKFKEEKDGRSCSSEIEMTAFLVFYAYKDHWKRARIKNPWENWFEADNFFRRYIKPKNDWVLARVSRNPKLLAPVPKQPIVFREGDDAQEAWKTACKNGRLLNAPLREVFTPWLSD